MSEASAPDLRIPVRLARVVVRIVAESAAVAEHRSDVRTLAKALKNSQADLSVDADGVLQDGGAAVMSDDPERQDALALLAGRLRAYGVERLVLSEQAADADLFDLVKLLATAPDQPDPPAFFAARVAAVDARAIPRTLRPSAPEIVEAASVEEPASVTEPATVGEPASVREPTPPPEDKRSALLTESLPVPETSDEDLRTLFATLQATESIELLREPLNRLTTLADIAFRTGRFARMADAMVGLVAIEHLQLGRDASDERRREFGRAVRRMATPIILRQVAIMRRAAGHDPERVRPLQSLLQRYGSDGAEAMIDEWANATTAEGRDTCLEALRALSRTHDALFDVVRHTDALRARQAIELLGALGDTRSEQLVLEQLRHPDVRTRRDVVAALERFPSVAALDALGVALTDEADVVRLRAVGAITLRGAGAVKLLAPLLESERDRDVLFAAIAGLGSVGGAGAVQVLVRAANGETQHPWRRGASYRLQACAALARIRTPQAMAVVQGLCADRDREVREGTMRLVAQVARRGTTAVREVADA